MGAPARKRLPLRWLTLGEIVGIVAVTIAALGYWDSHRERVLTDAQQAAAAREQKAQAQAAARAGALKQTFLMTGAPQDAGEWLRLTSVHAEQVIQTQALTLPSAVRGDTVQTTGNPRIEAGWLEGGLSKALKDRGDKSLKGRVPIGIVTDFIEDGQTKTDRSLYLAGYSLQPRVLRPAKVQLEGITLVRRGVGEDVQAAVDGAWARAAN
jgi:hypothetical protein